MNVQVTSYCNHFVAFRKASLRFTVMFNEQTYQPVKVFLFLTEDVDSHNHPISLSLFRRKYQPNVTTTLL